MFMIKYARLLQSIVECSHDTDTQIFGARYKNIYHLMSDISFLNTLWVKGSHSQITNNQLSELIFKAHRMLRIQIYTGLLVFFIPLMNAAVKIGV